MAVAWQLFLVLAVAIVILFFYFFIQQHFFQDLKAATPSGGPSYESIRYRHGRGMTSLWDDWSEGVTLDSKEPEGGNAMMQSASDGWREDDTTHSSLDNETAIHVSYASRPEPVGCSGSDSESAQDQKGLRVHVLRCGPGVWEEDITVESGQSETLRHHTDGVTLSSAAGEESCAAAASKWRQSCSTVFPGRSVASLGGVSSVLSTIPDVTLSFSCSMPDVQQGSTGSHALTQTNSLAHSDQNELWSSTLQDAASGVLTSTKVDVATPSLGSVELSVE